MSLCSAVKLRFVPCFIFLIPFMIKFTEKHSQSSEKLSSFLQSVNISYSNGNCLQNSFNIHIGIKHLLWQMGQMTSSSAV